MARQNSYPQSHESFYKKTHLTTPWNPALSISGLATYIQETVKALFKKCLGPVIRLLFLPWSISIL